MTSTEVIRYVADQVTTDGVIVDATSDGVRVEPADHHRHPVVLVWSGHPDDSNEITLYQQRVVDLAESMARPAVVAGR